MISGLKFLLHFNAPKNKTVVETKHTKIVDYDYIFNHYKSLDKQSKKSIIIFSGFSVYGFKDVRIDALAKAIAETGYNVFIPQIESIENLEITSNTLKEMSLFIEFIAKNKAYTKSGSVGVLAPSFSGGMILNAIAKNKLDNFNDYPF